MIQATRYICSYKFAWRGFAASLGLASPTQGNRNSEESVATTACNLSDNRKQCIQQIRAAAAAAALTDTDTFTRRAITARKQLTSRGVHSLYAPSLSLPSILCLSLSPLYPLFFNCAWPTLFERNCNRSALFLQKYLTNTRSDSCICKAQLGMDRETGGDVENEWTPAQDVLNAWEPVTASCNMQQMRHADKAYNASTSHNDVV